MNGTIYFNDLSELAEFLKHFTGTSTAKFDVAKHRSQWLLTFTGGF
jgi:hypothetical protein